MGAKRDPRVAVMMATYNGEKYIESQIRSIMCQEGVEVSLLISDDGSTDETIPIIQRLSVEYKNIIWKVNHNNIGLARNFMSIAEMVQPDHYDYFAFSDQDDYWMPEKLRMAVEKLEAIREPALYYSDVTNTDESLGNRENEFSDFIPFENSLKTLLLVNWASGCTEVFNRNLFDLVYRNIPTSYPRNHDAWIHLVAMTCGVVVGDLEHSYILRRITGNNAVGKRNFGSISPKRLLRGLCNLTKVASRPNTKTAQLLLKYHDQDMFAEAKKLIYVFQVLPESLPERFHVVTDPEFRVPSLSETLLIKIKLLLNRV